MRRQSTAEVRLRRCREAAVGRLWDGRTSSVKFCAAALFLLISGLGLRADQIESSDAEAHAGSTPGLFGASATPGTPEAAPPDWTNDIWTRSQLTGDWAGSRNELAENGVTFFGDIT